MRKIKLMRGVAAGAMVGAVAACAGSQSGSSLNTSETTAGGDVAMINRAGGLWVDSAAGIWMDTTGAIWMRVMDGTRLEAMPSDVAGFTNANVLAHVSLGDSLEIALSAPAETRAEHAEVRDFAHRMVKEHSSHEQTAMQLASSAGLSPMRAMTDTADARMEMRVANLLDNAHKGLDYDRKFMRAEVIMHQHMLHDLKLFQAQASGSALQLVNQTIPVVQKHLRDAQTILFDVSTEKAKLGPRPIDRP
jgi:predicted outer membrane protein